MINPNGTFSCDSKKVGECIECGGTKWCCKPDCRCKCLTPDGWKSKI